MVHYEVEALMRFTATVSYNGLSSKADTLIDTAASLNFVSKHFVETNGLYKIAKLFLSYRSEWLISKESLRPNSFVLRFTYNSESYLTLKVRILYWDYQL